MKVHTVPILSDNYGFILQDEEEGLCGVVDPGESEPIFEALTRLSLEPDVIFVTHSHGDHVGGIRELKEEFDCKVLGPGRYASRIPGLDVHVSEGDEIPFGGSTLQVMEMPGHTLDHVVYWDREDGHLFAGDVLFGVGCGRVMEGSPKRMWYNLERLRDLPDETRVYCGHEYTSTNIMFALGMDPDNEALKARALDVMALRRDGKPTVPFRLGEDKEINPFLRADDPYLMGKCLVKDSAAACFAVLRQRKDEFKVPKVKEE